MIQRGGGTRSPQFIEGIFTNNWGSFHLGKAAEKHTEKELSLPLFPGPRQRHPGRQPAEDDVFVIKEPGVVSGPG